MILLREGLLSLAHGCNFAKTTTEFCNSSFVYFVPLPEGHDITQAVQNIGHDVTWVVGLRYNVIQKMDNFDKMFHTKYNFYKMFHPSSAQKKKDFRKFMVELGTATGILAYSLHGTARNFVQMK